MDWKEISKELDRVKTAEDLQQWFLKMKAYEKMQTYGLESLVVLEETSSKFKATFKVAAPAVKMRMLSRESNVTEMVDVIPIPKTFLIQSTFGGINIYAVPT